MNSRKYPNKLLKEHGQAMVEFVIAMLVLIPVLLMIPLLGNYNDIKMATISAARYEGWERTVFDGRSVSGHASKSDGALRQEVIENFYSDYNPSRPSGATLQPKAQWVDKSGSSLLYPFSQSSKLSNSTVAKGETGMLTAEVRTFNTAIQTTNRIANLGLPGGSTVNTSALVASTLRVSVRPIPDISVGILRNDSSNAPISSNSDVSFAADIGNHFILADAWNASGPDNGPGSVVSMVTTMVPTSGGGSIATLSGIATTMMKNTPLSPIPQAQFNPGSIKPDIVPDDRK